MMARVAEWGRHLAENAFDLLFTLAMMTAILAIGLYTAQSDVVGGAVLLERSSINGVDLSGMDADRALAHIIRAEEERLLDGVSLTLEAGEHRETYGAADLGAVTDAAEVFTAAMEPLRKGGVTGRTAAYYRLRDGLTCPVTIAYDSARAEEICRNFAEQFYLAPRDASIRLSAAGDSLEYVDAQDGRRVDSVKLFSQVWAKLRESGVVRVAADMEVVPAQVSMQALRENTVSLADEDTALEPQDEAAARELLERLNGLAIPAGGEMRLRETLFGEEEVTQPAAASQIATTLYRALLLSGSEIVERHPCDIPPDYALIGLDAALDQRRNLRMRNRSHHPLYIIAGARDGAISVEVYGGLGSVDGTVGLRSVIVETIQPPPPQFIDDRTLAPGELKMVTPAREGYRVSSYRETVRDGEIVSSELLSMDDYAPVQEIFHKGS